MRRGAASSLLAALLVLLLALPGFAWTVTHWDADDFEIAPDIHKATKRVFMVAPERWRFQIRVAVNSDPTIGCVCCSTPAGGRARTS